MSFKMLENHYGKELVLDLHECNPDKFSRNSIEEYLEKLCSLIEMEREDLHFWDYDGVPQEELPTEEHLLGTSAIQFIKTSNITIHTLDILKTVYLNIFSCKDFDADVARDFSEEWFEGEIVSYRVVNRHKKPKVEIIKQKGHNFLWINDYLWMWDIPVERKYQKKLAGKAYGDVLVLGYGLGIVQRCLSENPNVKSIRTIENTPQVIDECKKVYGKIYGEIEISDFFKYETHKRFDCVIGDIWEEILPEFIDDYKRIKAKAVKLIKENGKYIAWGQEYFEYLIEKE